MLNNIIVLSLAGVNFLGAQVRPDAFPLEQFQRAFKQELAILAQRKSVDSVSNISRAASMPGFEFCNSDSIRFSCLARGASDKGAQILYGELLRAVTEILGPPREIKGPSTESVADFGKTDYEPRVSLSLSTRERAVSFAIDAPRRAAELTPTTPARTPFQAALRDVILASYSNFATIKGPADGLFWKTAVDLPLPGAQKHCYITTFSDPQGFSCNSQFKSREDAFAIYHDLVEEVSEVIPQYTRSTVNIDSQHQGTIFKEGLTGTQIQLSISPIETLPAEMAAQFKKSGISVPSGLDLMLGVSVQKHGEDIRSDHPEELSLAKVYEPPAPAGSSIASEIEAIARSGHYIALPSPEASHSAGLSRTAVSRTIENQTSYTLHLLMSGPIDHRIEVPAGGSANFELPPGTYRTAARVDGTGVLPFFGVQTFQANTQYTSQFYIRSR